MARPLAIVNGDRLLVCRTDRLGDLILALPLVSTLKARYPDIGITVAASPYAAPVLENHPAVDDIIAVDTARLAGEESYRHEFTEKVQTADFAAALVLYPDQALSRALFKARVRYRIGTMRRFQSRYFNRFLFHSRKRCRRHEAEYNLDYLKYFRPGPTVYIPRVYVTDKERERARRILSGAGVENHFVVLHPGSGGSADRWPLNRFAELYYSLVGEAFPVIITGSENEGRELDRAAAGKLPGEISLAGKTDLRTLAAVLEKAAVVVANSTGPLHLAAAVGTPVVGLYPRRQAMHPVRWGPLGEGHTVLQPGGDDMDTIGIERVVRSVRAAIGNEREHD